MFYTNSKYHHVAFGVEVVRVSVSDCPVHYYLSESPKAPNRGQPMAGWQISFFQRHVARDEDGSLISRLLIFQISMSTVELARDSLLRQSIAHLQVLHVGTDCHHAVPHHFTMLLASHTDLK
jgi:hypothetical protein